MNDHALSPSGAASGLLFVVLSLVGAFLYPQQPRSDSPPAATLAWVHDHRAALQAGMVISLFAAGVFVWFVGILRQRLAAADERLTAINVVVLAGGVALAVMLALSVLPTSILAFMDSQPAGLHDPSLVRMLGDLNTVFFSMVSVMIAVFLLAVGLVILQRHALGVWLGWLCIVIAAVNCVSVWVEITFSSYHGKVWNAVGWGAYIGFLVLTVVTSAAMLGRRRAPAESASVALS